MTHNHDILSGLFVVVAVLLAIWLAYTLLAEFGLI